MKITIELTEAEVKGLKDYLKEVSGDINPKISKEDIKQEIQGIQVQFIMVHLLKLS